MVWAARRYSNDLIVLLLIRLELGIRIHTEWRINADSCSINGTANKYCKDILMKLVQKSMESIWNATKISCRSRILKTRSNIQEAMNGRLSSWVCALNFKL